MQPLIYSKHSQSLRLPCFLNETSQVLRRLDFSDNRQLVKVLDVLQHICSVLCAVLYPHSKSKELYGVFW